MQDDGTIFVVWTQTGGTDTSGYGVYGRYYTADGTALGDAFLINGYTNSTQSEPEVIALADGGWLVSWTSDTEDGSNQGVYARRYDAAGNAVTGEFLVNQYTYSTQWQSSLAARSDGGFVIAWSSYYQDAGSSYGIESRLYFDPFEGDNSDNILLGTSGNDTLIGGTGNDIFVYARGDGTDVIDNTGEGPSSDVVQFGDNIVATDLWFSYSGNDLIVSVMGSDGSVAVRNWATGSGANVVSAFILSDGSTLGAAEVNSLITSAASVTTGVPTTLTTDQQSVYNQFIAANWHALA